MDSEKWFGIDRQEIQWFPTIEYDKCIGCMACFNKCKRGVYAEECGKPKVVNPYNCVVGCTGCQNVCPKHAISHPPKSYLEKLSKRKDFEVGCQCKGEDCD
jgi:NAD-dependent dihydropyrimidine dehydrogenase PreA subunit